MKPLHQSSIDDLASLQMENELLMHEIRYLRARVTSAERESPSASSAQPAVPKRTKVVAAKDRLMPAKSASKPAGPGASLGVEEKRRQTEEDLRWLLRRLDESPLGVLLRRKQGFRTLLSRYPHRP